MMQNKQQAVSEGRGRALAEERSWCGVEAQLKELHFSSSLIHRLRSVVWVLQADVPRQAEGLLGRRLRRLQLGFRLRPKQSNLPPRSDPDTESSWSLAVARETQISAPVLTFATHLWGNAVTVLFGGPHKRSAAEISAKSLAKSKIPARSFRVRRMLTFYQTELERWWARPAILKMLPSGGHLARLRPRHLTGWFNLVSTQPSEAMGVLAGAGIDQCLGCCELSAFYESGFRSKKLTSGEDSLDETQNTCWSLAVIYYLWV